MDTPHHESHPPKLTKLANREGAENSLSKEYLQRFFLLPDQDNTKEWMESAAFQKIAESPQKKRYLERISIFPDQINTNKWLECLVIDQDIPMLDFLLDLPEGCMKPDQSGINVAFKKSVLWKLPKMVEYLLSLPQDSIRPDQQGMNEACNLAVSKQNKIVIETFQRAVKLFFTMAVRQGDLTKIEYLLNLPDETMRPRQNEIDHAFTSAATKNGNQQIVTLFLNPSNRNARPSQGVIDQSYREAETAHQRGMALILMPHVSVEERNHHAGQAFEANDQLHLSQKPTNTSINLITAIFESMSSRVPSEWILPFSHAATLINNAINTHIPEGKRAIAREAAFAKLSHDNDYEKQISLAVSFIILNHYESMGTWIQGFVGESIDAYKGDKGTISCSKGIKERIAAGLKTIDKELDQLFGHAEVHILIKDYINLWNSHTPPAKLAQMLMSGGFVSQNSFKNAAKIFRKIFDKKITDLGLSITDYSAEKNAIIERLKGCYADIQKAAREIENARKER